MRTIAILPIKTLDRAKRRLSGELDASPLRALVEAMFSDTLVALRRTTSIDRLLVVSADTVAQQIASGYGAEVIADADAGHSDAARRGIDRAIELRAERVLLIPGDCPMLDPVEIDALVRRDTPERSLLVVPDRHGSGTNALLITPPGACEPSFGVSSHERHLQLAREAGVSGETVPVASLALDLDTPEDLSALEAELERRRGGAAHTRGMLRQLGRSRASATAPDGAV